MSVTRLTVEDDVAKRLGDASKAVWAAAELQRYIQDGYDDLCLRTLCLWKKEAPAGLQEVSGTAEYTLPTALYKIDRLSYKKRRLVPLDAAKLQRADPAYRSTQGDIYGYVVEGDGVTTVRYVRVPSASGSNISIEYFRRGTALSADGTTFEIPDRYVKYVRFYALWRAFERDGPGQDLKMAEHYQARYLEGVRRMQKRREAFQSSRTGRMGGEVPRNLGRRDLPTLPWQYGRFN